MSNALPRREPLFTSAYTCRPVTTTVEACLHNSAQARTDLRRTDRLELLATILGLADAASGPAESGSSQTKEIMATGMMEDMIKRFEDAVRARALIDASNAINALR